MQTDMFGLGCARGMLLMWQRTYPQCPHPEGSKFESIRTNRLSTKLHPVGLQSLRLVQGVQAPRLVLFQAQYHIEAFHEIRAAKLLLCVYRQVKSRVMRHGHCLQACRM